MKVSVEHMKKVIGIVIAVIGIILVAIRPISMLKDGISISTIGGVDEPTSVFVAGKVNDVYLLLAGIILLLIGFFIAKRKH